MSPDRKYRSRNEVTADLLVKRLGSYQLTLLVGQPGYEDYQDKILERLQPIDGFGLDAFKKIHPSTRGFNVEEVEIGKNIYIHGVDIDLGSWGKDVPLKRLKCNLHNVTSIEFFDYGRERREGPFRRSID